MKLQSVQKDHARRQEAVAKIQDLNDSFSKNTEKKLTEKLEAMEEKKNEQIKQLQERLHDHVCYHTHPPGGAGGGGFSAAHECLVHHKHAQTVAFRMLQRILWWGGGGIGWHLAKGVIL